MTERPETSGAFSHFLRDSTRPYFCDHRNEYWRKGWGITAIDMGSRGFFWEIDRFSRTGPLEDEEGAVRGSD